MHAMSANHVPLLLEMPSVLIGARSHSHQNAAVAAPSDWGISEERAKQYETGIHAQFDIDLTIGREVASTSVIGHDHVDVSQAIAALRDYLVARSTLSLSLNKPVTILSYLSSQSPRAAASPQANRPS